MRCFAILYFCCSDIENILIILETERFVLLLHAFCSLAMRLLCRRSASSASERNENEFDFHGFNIWHYYYYYYMLVRKQINSNLFAYANITYSTEK